MPYSIEPQSIVAGLAAIAAWLAALFAYKTYCISKKSLELVQLERTEGETNICAYLVDSFVKYDDKTNEKKHIFLIEYSNKSEKFDSVTQVFLETYYVNSENRVSSLISNSEQETEKWLENNEVSSKLPIDIQPRSAVTNWFVFSVSPIALQSTRIQKYCVIAKNSKGIVATLESYILREQDFEKKNN